MLFRLPQKITLFALAAVLCVFFAPPATIQAQSVDDLELYSERDISFDVIPEVPGPYENVNLRLKSFTFNLNNYFISWFVDGKQTQSGVGSREFDFKMRGSGEAVNITAVVKIGSDTYRKQFGFIPSSVDMLWEAIDAYTPPFYKGKALPLRQSLVEVIAVPETQLIEATDAPNLVYYWKNNESAQKSESGFGQQSYTFKTNPLNTEEKIEVRVTDSNERSQAINSVRIPIEKYQPRILFYETNEHGRLMLNKALNTFGTTRKDAINMTFHPLFFSTTKPNFTDLFVEWTLNNEIIRPQDFAEQNRLNISAQGKKGEAVIGMTVEGINTLFQEDQEMLRIQFQ